MLLSLYGELFYTRAQLLLKLVVLRRHEFDELVANVERLLLGCHSLLLLLLVEACAGARVETRFDCLFEDHGVLVRQWRSRLSCAFAAVVGWSWHIVLTVFSLAHGTN